MLLVNQGKHTAMNSRMRDVCFESEIKLRQSVLTLRYYTATYLMILKKTPKYLYEGWNFNSGNYLFTTDTK